MKLGLLTVFVPQLQGSFEWCHVTSAGRQRLSLNLQAEHLCRTGARVWQCESFGREAQWVLHIIFTMFYRSGCKRSKLKAFTQRGYK